MARPRNPLTKTVHTVLAFLRIGDAHAAPVEKPPVVPQARTSGQAVVTIGGRDHYLGPFGTRASKVEYDRLIAEYLASGRQLPRRAEQVMVCAVMAAFLRHAKTYYRSPDGTLSGEIGNFIDAFKPLRKLYGDTSVADFGPLALKAVRQEMVAMKWCRLTVNRHVGRIKHVFRWAVENELVEAAVYDRLRAVIGLRAGRCDAHDPEPVQPVPEDVVEATLPYLSPTVAAMVRLQLLTAARPGEICQMRGVGFDMSRNPWQYRPATHKTAWHGHERVIHFGPRAKRSGRGSRAKLRTRKPHAVVTVEALVEEDAVGTEVLCRRVRGGPAG